MNKVLEEVAELTDESFVQWAEDFVGRLEESNMPPEMTSQFMTAYLGVKDTNPLTKQSFLLYNELLYGDNEMLHRITLPLTIAFYDYVSAAFAFKRELITSEKVGKLAKELIDTSMPLFMGDSNDSNEEE